MMSSQTGALKILHIVTALSWRGGEQQVAYLVTELKQKRVRQFVLCSQDSAMEKFCSGNGISFFTSKKKSSFDLFYAAKISKICKEDNISIIHTHDSHAHTFALLAVLLYGCKSKIIVSRRVDFEVSNNPLSKFKYNHESIKRIICVSEAIRQMTARAVDDNSKLVTIHSGIDLSRFDGRTNNNILHKEFFLSDKTRIIANVAAIAPHKDYKTFVDTVSILKDKLNDTVYFIIGDGPEKENIQKYVTSKGLDQIIFMTGFRNDIADIFPEIDLMLITSETEGLGTSILDAFASGVPVVATAAGGIPEIVIHEQTGLLAAVKDAPGLAAAVLKVMNDGDLREVLVSGAKQHLNNFTTAHTCNKTLHEYHAVAGVSL